MFTIDQLELPRLGLRGLEAGLSEEEAAIKDATHRFAEEVMRPVGRKLDHMTPEEVIADGSPLHDYMAQMNAAGILDLGALAEMTNEQKARVFPLIFEELGWGDSGLAIATLASSIPAFTAHTSGDPEIIERFGSVPGCWLATQPDRGSDVVDMEATEVHTGSRQGRGNLSVRKEGDEYVVNGQSAAWVSYAPLAQTAMAYLPCDYGDGLQATAADGINHTDQGLNHVGVLIPLDLPGVSRGKPLDKLGQRALPQGEVFFDEVRIPAKYAISTAFSDMPTWFDTDRYTAKNTRLIDFYFAAAEASPGIRFHQYDSAYDWAQVLFVKFLSGEEVQLYLPLKQNQAELSAGLPYIRSYTTPGRFHTVLRFDELYTREVAGVPAVEWIGDILAGKPVVNVDCGSSADCR